MPKIIALGGAGHIGACGVRQLIKRVPDIEIIIADYNLNAAQELAKELGRKTVAILIDVKDFKSLVQIMKGADVVINTVGPYYLFGEPIVKAAIEAKTPLVDVCDDGDATLKMLEYDRIAKKTGIPIIVGLGATPGITNLMALCGAKKLDIVNDIDTAWAWSALDPKMTGRAIVDHYFHAISGDILTYRDGAWVKIPAMSVTRTMEFSMPIGFLQVDEVGHPEPVTIPRYIQGVKNVTNNGGIWPKRFTDIAMFMKNIGLSNLIEMNVNEHKVSARDVATAIILSLPTIATDLIESMIKEVVDLYGEFGIDGVSLRVDVRGEKNGRFAQRSFRCRAAADLITSLPCVLGALMIIEGKIKKAGVYAPEGIIDCDIFFEMLKKDIPVEEISVEYI